MKANNTQTLNVSIATDETLTSETLNCEVATYTRTTQSHKRYLSKLRLQSRIQRELAPKLNAKREAKLLGFHTEDDKFIPADEHENLVALMIANHRANANA